MSPASPRGSSGKPIKQFASIAISFALWKRPRGRAIRADFGRLNRSAMQADTTRSIS